MFHRMYTICPQINFFTNRRKSVQYAIFWYYSIKQPYSLELFFTKENQIYNRIIIHGAYAPAPKQYWRDIKFEKIVGLLQ